MRNVLKQEATLLNKVAAAKETFVEEEESGSVQEQIGKSDLKEVSSNLKKDKNDEDDQ